MMGYQKKKEILLPSATSKKKTPSFLPHQYSSSNPTISANPMLIRTAMILPATLQVGEQKKKKTLQSTTL